MLRGVLPPQSVHAIGSSYTNNVVVIIQRIASFDNFNIEGMLYSLTIPYFPRVRLL